jgi:hypothetical protein
MINYKKLIEDLTYKGVTKELWYDPKNYIQSTSSNSPLYYKSGFREKDIPFQIRVPLSTQYVNLSIYADFGTQAGYITIQPGKDISFEVNIDTSREQIEYKLTYYYKQNLALKDDVALVLKTYTVFDFINLSKHINVKPANTDIINDKFRVAFSKVESDDAKLDWLYENAYPSAVKLRGDEKLWADMLRLSKYDGKKWFVDTGSAIVNIVSGFSEAKSLIDKVKKNQKAIMDVYNTISDYDTKKSFASLISGISQIEGNDLYKPIFLDGKKYRIISEKSENENKLFRIINKKNLGSSLAPSIGGGVSVPYDTYTTIETADLDPFDLVIIKNPDIKINKKNPAPTPPSAAIMLYYIADNEAHEDLVKLTRLTLDIVAILSAAYSGGTIPLLIRTFEAGIAITDIAMMNDEIRNFLKENGFDWFVDNWDTIYLMVGMGFISNFILKGIVTRGPAVLEFLKNIKNVPKNWNLFKKDLELLIKEASAYEAKQAAKLAAEGGQKIEEVVIKGDKYGLWRKILNLASSPEKYVEKIVEDLATKGLSLNKTEEGLYELLYNGRVIKVGKDFEIGRFVRNSFYLGVKDKNLLPAFTQLSKEIISKVGKRELRQQYDDLDQLYKLAKKANEELVEMTKKVAKETNGKAGVRPKEINNGLKSRERALEKINSDYVNPVTKEPEANLLVDIAGSKIVYNKLSNLYKALEKVNKEYKILRIKDRIQTPVDSGYRDILMNLEMKNGHIVEFRLHLKEIDEVAANGGHKLYQQRRTLDAISTQRDLNLQELKMRFKLIKQEMNLYEGAWQKILKK